MSSQDLSSDLQPLRICTVSHGIEDFDLLIEDLERIMPGQWGDLRFHEADPFLNQPDAADLEALIIALDEDDHQDLETVAVLIETVAERRLPILLVCDGLTPDQLKIVLRKGGDEYLPYPPREGALQEALTRLGDVKLRDVPASSAWQDDGTAAFITDDASTPTTEQPAQAPLILPATARRDPAPVIDDAQAVTEPGPGHATPKTATDDTEYTDELPDPAGTAQSQPPAALAPIVKSGPARVIAFQSLIGGAGASTIAVNLAHELAQLDKKNRKSVCLMDFDMQFGTVALHRDLAEKAAVIDLLSDTDSMDDESFRLALQPGEDGVSALTAPEDLIPLDFVNGDDVAKLIETAARCFDFVIIDMPRSIQDWTETVISRSDRFMAVLQVDVASAQNVLRLRRALQAEGKDTDRLQFILNRAPRRTELNARGRMQSMAQALGITFDAVIPADPSAATAAADQGEPLAKAAARSPLRKAIVSLAKDILASQDAPAA